MALFDAPALSPGDQRVLDRIAEIRAEVGMFVQPAHRWTGSLARVQRARNAQASSAIEGHNVALEDALRIQDGLLPEQASALDEAALLGFRDAMNYLIQLARDESYAYDIGSLRAIHRLMTLPYRNKLVELELLGRRDHQDPRPGLWRRAGISVTDDSYGVAFEGPPVTEVPLLMDELVEVLNNPRHDSAIVCAAMAHLNFVSIHPFADGNGRMSRAVQTLVLARTTRDLAPEFVGVEEWLAGHRKAYYGALSDTRTSWQPERSASGWVRFCLEAHLGQAEVVLRRTKQARVLGERIADEVAGAGLPERTETALLEVAQGRSITNAGYRQQLGDTGITQNKAAGDLRRMVDLGLLRAHGAGRGSYYTAGARIEKISGTD
jgi:Fic family protein